ncbi:hypothetical protein SUGI_0432940 [Cryptomeria japonica]|uniref:photosystem II D1 precursor processing protein PSB27-H2, chloroplastic isoform X2 n=1 Tax=Cryptomeria japonica TaxID=3369 RepID=UPI002408B9C7|nr:photosystem II D1 precursor processing protein PSB27-H2, chloroplastic isoform X2 [Cryptomeria japonica]GLJ22950.1 hypothetical protein SUGI_0432940 [Cryptomeria japonica]
MLQGCGGARTRDLIQAKSTLISVAGKLQFSWRIRTLPCHSLKHKRRLLIFVGTTLGGSLLPLNFLHAEEGKENTSAEKKSDNDDDEGLVGGLLTLFDPNEKTKSGRVLPKSYLKSAREVVKNLRESLKEDVKDTAKFRRTADSAKEAIRDFMQNWTGQKAVASEDSYTALVSAIRVLANFYSKKGPTAAMPEDIKTKVMDDLNSAEAAL